MKVSLLRKDGFGIKGTYRNVDHHAQVLRPMVEKLEAAADEFGFKTWRQGHNVHVFENEDGRRFDIVPYADESGYIGLQYRFRESRSKAIPLMAATNLTEISSMIRMIKSTAKPMAANQSHRFNYEKD